MHVLCQDRVVGPRAILAQVWCYVVLLWLCCMGCVVCAEFGMPDKSPQVSLRAPSVGIALRGVPLVQAGPHLYLETSFQTFTTSFGIIWACMYQWDSQGGFAGLFFIYLSCGKLQNFRGPWATAGAMPKFFEPAIFYLHFYLFIFFVFCLGSQNQGGEQCQCYAKLMAK